MNFFSPDVIVEVTGACNRVCAGCYAPNVVSKEGVQSLFEKQPQLFIGIIAINNAFNHLGGYSNVIAIRGGEPSLHPKLPILLRIASTKGRSVFLETHGRWLLPESIAEYKELIEYIKKDRIIIKISFDKMHGLKKEELQTITDFLNSNNINYRIAVTESTFAEYMLTRSLCSWISDDKIIFQLKASSESELIKPNIGTINVRGEIQRTLTHRFENEEQLGVILA
jgi:organic radical activating enzyme